MEETTFRRIVVNELLPMLECSLEEGSLPSRKGDGLASYANPCRLTVKPARTAAYKLVIKRSQRFTAGERNLVGQFIMELSAVDSASSGEYQEDLVRAIPRRIVAKHLGGGEVLLNVLLRLENWSSQTYEGQRIVAAFGIVPENGTSETPIAGLFEQDFGPVLTNGFDTLIVCGNDGNVSEFRPLSYKEDSRTSPYRLRQIACWAENKRISAVLNRHGEILVFQDRSLRFARRHGRWAHYSHETNIRRLAPPQSRPFREALYESCLDVSFARTGGCLGVINARNLDPLARIVSERDMISKQKSYKARLLSTVVTTTFQELDRRFRQELLSLDGAVILDHQGHVLAVGAIIEVPAGSFGGGGRLAAAKKLSSLGLGIKISEDGTIIGFRDEKEILKT